MNKKVKDYFEKSYMYNTTAARHVFNKMCYPTSVQFWVTYYNVHKICH